jgi:hypothetical protein
MRRALIQRMGSLEPIFKTFLKLQFEVSKKSEKFWDVDNDGIYMCAKLTLIIMYFRLCKNDKFPDLRW